MFNLVEAVKRFFASDGSITTSQELGAVLLRSGLETQSGIAVTPATAMRLIAVNACVRVLSETLAQVPLILYSRSGDGVRKRETENPLYRILHDKPNRWQTSFEWREMLEAHLALRGNAYCLKVFTNRTRGTVSELIPINPDRVKPRQASDWSITYDVAGGADGRTSSTLEADEILHLRGLAFNGVEGVSPIRQAREGIGLALNAEAFGARFFGNSARPSGLLSSEMNLGEDRMKEIVESWNAQHKGPRALGTAVLDGGFKFTPLTMSGKDAQFIETRKMQVTEIARLFGVPPHMIADLDKATFSNIEHQSINFVRFTMAPWFTRWEGTLNEQLLTDQDRDAGLFAEFLLDGLLRGDTKSRYESHSLALRDGWRNVNEVRRLENEAPIGPQGDVYRQAENVFGGNTDPTGASDENDPDPDATAAA